MTKPMPVAEATPPAREAITSLPLIQPTPIAPLRPMAVKKSTPAKAIPRPEPVPRPVTQPDPKPQIKGPDTPASTLVQAPHQAPATVGDSTTAPQTDLTPADPKVTAAPPPVQASVPRYDLNPKPDYPALARRRGYQGTVLLKVLVNTRGQATQVELARSSGHELLDRSALKSVATWRFEPALRNGQPIDMWVEVPVRFEIQ